MKNESFMTGRLAPSATPQAMLSVPPVRGENSRLQSLWQGIRVWFQPNHELRVWQECDRRGNWLWCAYNPLTDQEVAFPTDEQLCQWIENPTPRDSGNLN